MKIAKAILIRVLGFLVTLIFLVMLSYSFIVNSIMPGKLISPVFLATFACGYIIAAFLICILGVRLLSRLSKRKVASKPKPTLSRAKTVIFFILAIAVVGAGYFSWYYYHKQELLKGAASHFVVQCQGEVPSAKTNDTLMELKVTENISQPQDKFVTANSLKLHYLDWGNPNAFEVAAHNFLSSSSA